MQKIGLFLRRKCHSSWLLAVWALGILCGVATAEYFFFGEANVLLVLAILLGAIGLWRGKRYAVFFMIVSGFMMGCWRSSDTGEVNAAYQSHVGEVIVVSGEIAEDVEIDPSGTAALRLKNISLNDKKIPGKVWVSLAGADALKRGDIVWIEGKASRGFASFSLAMYRAHLQHVLPNSSNDFALTARDNFGDRVRQVISEPAASLGMGFVAGQRRALPPDLVGALQAAGLMHIVVASGYNLTILVRFSRRLIGRISRKAALVASLGLITSFIAVTGASPSMMRAGLVAVVALLAWFLGRKFHPAVLILCAAAATVLIDPSYLRTDLGWQLSFAAFGGVMIIAPVFQRYFFGKNKPGVLRQILGETFCAQIATLPIILGTFGVYSNIALIANILIVPLIPLAMLLVFLTGIAGTFFSETIAHLVAFPAQELLNYIVWVVESLARFGWSQGEFFLPAWGVWASYGALGIIVLMGIRKTKLQLRDTNIVT